MVDAPTQRTRVRRGAARGVYERALVDAVVDAALICHVAYVEDGEPRTIPTAIVRRGDHVYVHGNRRSAMIRALGAGGLACVTVTHLDGVVAARSGFHCSMNYRSVVIYGRGEAVAEADKAAVLDAFVDALIPGHARRVRRPTREELSATAVVRIPLAEASAKVRAGPPVDDPGDLDLDVWAGVVPITLVAGIPEDAGDLPAGVARPDYATGYRRVPA